VEFQVEKNAGAEFFKLPHDRGALSGEKLEADLEKAALAEQRIGEPFGGVGVWSVDGYNDFFLRGAGRGGHLLRRMTIDAPAKVNLTLRVLGRRPDGFHDIETLMAPLDLADRLEVDLKDSPGVDFSCSDSSLPMDGSNLVCKAVAAFSHVIGRDFGVRIHLEKNIPHGAGLGGGSSDAAAVLKALNELLGVGFSVEELENLAASIGSDVPFFIRCVPAICRGRGERIEPVAGIRGAEILLVKPPFPVSTAWAYGAWAAAPKSEATFAPMFGSISMVNDLEAPVFSKHLQLPGLKRWLAAQPGATAAMMSGSGSTVFAVLDGADEDLGGRVREEFGESFSVWRCRIAA
jgi:4-diphosphocytidyl-2-C-methyl-D-erythritol kinase